jgi:hypothetical protein
VIVPMFLREGEHIFARNILEITGPRRTVQNIRMSSPSANTVRDEVLGFTPRPKERQGSQDFKGRINSLVIWRTRSENYRTIGRA